MVLLWPPCCWKSWETGNCSKSHISFTQKPRWWHCWEDRHMFESSRAKQRAACLHVDCLFQPNLGALAHRPSRGANGKQTKTSTVDQILLRMSKYSSSWAMMRWCWRVLGLHDIDAVLCLGERERSGRSGCSYRGSTCCFVISINSCTLFRIFWDSDVLASNCLTHERRKIICSLGGS